MFVACSTLQGGLWKMDAATHGVQRLFALTDFCAVIGTAEDRWLAGMNFLAHLAPSSGKVEVLLADRQVWRILRSPQHASSWSLGVRPFMPEQEQPTLALGPYVAGGMDPSTAAVHGDELWARNGKSRIIVLHRGKGMAEATVMENNILEGGKVVNFFETSYGLMAVGEGSVGLIEGSP